MMKKYEKQFTIIEGKYYEAFRNWFQQSSFIGYGIETALYHAYVAGRLDSQIINSPSKLGQNKLNGGISNGNKRRLEQKPKEKKS